MSLLKLYEQLSQRFPEFNSVEILELTVMSYGLGGSLTDTLSWIQNHRDSADSFTALKKNIWPDLHDGVVSSLAQDRRTAAIWCNPSVQESQLCDLAKELSRHSQYNYLTLVSEKYLESRAHLHADEILHKLAVFEGTPVLLLPSDEYLSGFNFLDVVIASETRGGEQTSFPRHTKRVVQAHGLDNSFLGTVCEYSGGATYDYVLTTYPGEGDARAKPRLDSFVDMFPQELVEHASREVCAIPYGYPKVDRLSRRALELGNSMAGDILYSFSLWSHENQNAKKAMFRVLEVLLANFGDRNIVFRPYPGDLRQPEIQEAIKRFEDAPRFSVSVGDDYVDDYANAAVVISHRGSSTMVFTYATGRPSLRYLPGSNSNAQALETFELGYGARNEVQFIETLKHVLANPDVGREDRLAERDRSLANPGRSVENLVDNLHHLWSDEPHADWDYFPLFSDDGDSLPVREQYKRSCEKLLQEGRLNYWVVNSALEQFPGDPLFLFYRACIYLFHQDRFVDELRSGLDSIQQCLSACAKDPVVYGALYERAVDWCLGQCPDVILNIFARLEREQLDAEFLSMRKRVERLCEVPEFGRSFFGTIFKGFDFVKDKIDFLKDSLLSVQRNHASGLRLFDSGNFDSALECFEANLKVIPKHGDTLFYLALSYTQGGRFQIALQRVTQLILLEPNHLQAWSLWRSLNTCPALKSGMMGQYNRVLHQVTPFPSDKNVLILLADLALESGAVEHAGPLSAAMLKLGLPDLQQHMAELHALMNQSNGAS